MSAETPATILIVDDDGIVRRMLRDALEEHGYRVLLARNGAQAMKVFEEHTSISLVLTDVRMPLMSGPAFVAELLLRGMPRPLPILSMSGSEGEVPPGFDCIAKPFRLAQVLHKIEESLARRSAHLTSDRLKSAAAP